MTPKFRLIAIESSRGPRTPALEILAAYDPKAKDGLKVANYKKERVEHWIKNGAQLSDSARRLLKKEGVLS